MKMYNEERIYQQQENAFIWIYCTHQAPIFVCRHLIVCSHHEYWAVRQVVGRDCSQKFPTIM